MNVPMDPAEARAIQRLAGREFRDTQAQARALIVAGLREAGEDLADVEPELLSPLDNFDRTAWDRVVVAIPPDAGRRLRELAARELRTPRLQAAALIVAALTAAEE